LEQTYVWPSIDLLTGLGIKGRATTGQLDKFCEDMRGKDITFVIDALPEAPILTEKNMSQNMANNISDEIAKNLIGE